MVVLSTMFKVYDLPNSETLVSKLFQNFPVVNTTWEDIHIQFPIRKLVFTIILIASEGSISQAGTSVVSRKEKVHLKMNICWNCPQPQAIRDVDGFVSSSERIGRNVALRCLLTNGFPAVSPNSW